jgi:hypothetical protein
VRTELGSGPPARHTRELTPNPSKVIRMPKFPQSFRRKPETHDSWHFATRTGRRSRRFRVASVVTGSVLAAAVAYAATNWTVGLTGGSSGEAQSASVANISITAVASPAPTNLLFPGGTGDVVATITNTNAIPVTITAVSLPTNTTYAGGFTTSALSTAQTGCSSTTSLVLWNFATGVSASTHTLTTPLTVAANGTLTVTLTNDASMTAAAPAACENTFFSMPSLTGVTATAGAGTPTTSPATDAWTV